MTDVTPEELAQWLAELPEAWRPIRAERPLEIGNDGIDSVNAYRSCIALWFDAAMGFLWEIGAWLEPKSDYGTVRILRRNGKEPITMTFATMSRYRMVAAAVREVQK